ncbi:MAG TPA: cbb3-type cytochrome c oxidase subunit I [Oscillatoriaceae cyanobacterium]
MRLDEQEVFPSPRTPVKRYPLPRGADRRGVLVYMGISALVLVLMTLLGTGMRFAQGQWLAVSPVLFYRILTAHGVGMVGIMGLGSTAIMWYFLSQYVKLSLGVLYATLATFLVGVGMILGSIFVGGFAGAWTFLYPLPAVSMGLWDKGAAATFLGGLLVVGASFLLLYVDAARAILGRYGNLANALGWPQLFRLKNTYGPPAAVVASSMAIIADTVGLTAGATVLVMNLVNLFNPTFALDPLLVKSMTYFFGHVFINVTIYKSVIAVYELLPRYTGRRWKSNRVFLGAWNGSTLLVVVVFPHHLLMDFVMPTWMLVMGEIASWLNGLPILLVTAYGALMIVHRSNIRWDMASAFLFLSMFGWSAGVIPAIVDGTIVFNRVMHNTLWVPGHFHFYLLLGEASMFFGFMYYLIAGAGPSSPSPIDRASFVAYVVGGLGIVFSFLYAGMEGVPRRYATHLASWLAPDRVGAVSAVLVVAAVLVFALRFLTQLRAIDAA